ncbi:uncharacterized protein LOC123011012 [Tribolium madens]|uniref:uncharacterized protein LOC123011012 n=1 Tax=Tribolium madens TaxID=41895 RepID=UPI001CF73AE0|nr:uncharacterized protein LOC123011012 [Tribolium madens]
MKVSAFILTLFIKINYQTLAEETNGTVNFHCNETKYYPAEFCNGYYECKSNGSKWAPVLKTCSNKESFNITTKKCTLSSCQVLLLLLLLLLKNRVMNLLRIIMKQQVNQRRQLLI